MADEPGALTRWFRRAVLGRRWLCFVVLGLSFFAFGVGTVNLFRLLGANVSLIAEHGWQAVVDGGAQQLAELVATGYLSMMAWVFFMACEHRLVHWLNEE